MHATAARHINRIAGRIVEIINRNCPGRPVGAARIAVERGPRFAPISRLADTDAGLCIARRGVFTSASVERAVRGVVC